MKYLIFPPWEVSGKGPCNKYRTGQFHHTARQLMASFALTEALQRPGPWCVSGVCLPQAQEGRGEAGEERPPRASFYLDAYRISGIRVTQETDSSNRRPMVPARVCWKCPMGSNSLVLMAAVG